jgi:hypothetical protein
MKYALTLAVLITAAGPALAERPVPLMETGSYLEGVCTGLRASHTINPHSPIDVTLNQPHQVGYFICPATALGHLKPIVHKVYGVAPPVCWPEPYNTVQWDCEDGTFPTGGQRQ